MSNFVLRRSRMREFFIEARNAKDAVCGLRSPDNNRKLLSFTGESVLRSNLKTEPID